MAFYRLILCKLYKISNFRLLALYVFVVLLACCLLVQIALSINITFQFPPVNSSFYPIPPTSMNSWRIREQSALWTLKKLKNLLTLKDNLYFTQNKCVVDFNKREGNIKKRDLHRWTRTWRWIIKLTIWTEYFVWGNKLIQRGALAYNEVNELSYICR